MIAVFIHDRRMQAIQARAPRFSLPFPPLSRYWYVFRVLPDLVTLAHDFIAHKSCHYLLCRYYYVVHSISIAHTPDSLFHGTYSIHVSLIRSICVAHNLLPRAYLIKFKHILITRRFSPPIFLLDSVLICATKTSYKKKLEKKPFVRPFFPNTVP